MTSTFVQHLLAGLPIPNSRRLDGEHVDRFAVTPVPPLRPAPFCCFWIDEFQEQGKKRFQLQYTQRVLLNFNGLGWPHVSVANLIKH